MGGNALKTVNTRRYNADEYFAAASKVVDALCISGYCPRVKIIKAYRNKETFGDLDILYTTADDKPFGVEVVKALFNPDEVVRNTDVISFNFKDLQVDLIHTPAIFFDYASNYFAWNDQGNLVGRIAKKFGLKHGHDGLYLPIRDGDQVFTEILLTTSYLRSLAWLGFNTDQFIQGFDNLVDIFDWVAENPFYNPDFYKLEYLNHAAKIRDRKRSTYNAFLEYGAELESTGKQFWKPLAVRSEYLPQIFEEFPHALTEYDEAMRKLATVRYVRSRFNGNIVSELTGFEGKHLGAFMRHLKDNFWFSYASITYQTDEQLQKRILEEAESFIFN